MQYSALTSTRTTRRTKFSSCVITATPPLEDCIPVDVVGSADFFTLELPAAFPLQQELASGNWSDGLLTTVHCKIPLYLLRSKLVLGIGIWLVSDASKKHGKKAYAWTIATESEILCYNSGLIYVAVNSMTSYRAEKFGVLSLVVFLR